ncbi:MAG: GNAT family N-acetyltransferase [Ruminococcaceae bacterium]|nr:GNAT family N-acetyltransferase [Oscillospiraceae bacterium]
MNITYEWCPSTFILDNPEYEDIIQDCSHLFSTQYGKWGQGDPTKAGQNIKLSSKKLLEWLSDKNTSLYYAKDDNMLIGYAIALQLKVPNYGNISWVTQLVVHEKYRHKEIAKNLLHSIWGFSNNYAWGIISANPYAIRALEKTTRRRSNPIRIKNNLKKLISIGIEHLPYISEATETFVNSESSKINTNFFVDHSDVEKMIENVISDDTPWTLGKLDEGWEWLAFTFQDQIPFELTDNEIQSMLDASDHVVQTAYKRMNYAEGTQKWTSNTLSEVDYIIRECKLKPGNTLIDFGCGQGRHSLEIAKHGIIVKGIDYVDKNIEHANKNKNKLNIKNVNFFSGDCREIDLGCCADAAICLYDVIGTYADNYHNQKILNNISYHLKPGGIAIISVMNYDLTLKNAKYIFSLKTNPELLLSLAPSNIMETTGNIFNPDYYLVDTVEQIVYRREQFNHGRSLPIELIVRDKRFRKDDIVKMCEKAGLTVVSTAFVSAKDWNYKLDSLDNSAKEILIKCQKQLH